MAVLGGWLLVVRGLHLLRGVCVLLPAIVRPWSVSVQGDPVPPLAKLALLLYLTLCLTLPLRGRLLRDWIRRRVL